MRCLLALTFAFFAAAASPPPRDIPLRSADIEKVEVTAFTVMISFSSQTQTDALAQDRELSVGISFSFPAAKSLYISSASHVAHRLATISFTLPTPEDAQLFAQAIRDGRVQFATHKRPSQLRDDQ